MNINPRNPVGSRSKETTDKLLGKSQRNIFFFSIDSLIGSSERIIRGVHFLNYKYYSHQKEQFIVDGPCESKTGSIRKGRYRPESVQRFSGRNRYQRQTILLRLLSRMNVWVTFTIILILFLEMDVPIKVLGHVRSAANDSDTQRFGNSQRQQRKLIVDSEPSTNAHKQLSLIHSLPLNISTSTYSHTSHIPRIVSETSLPKSNATFELLTSFGGNTGAPGIMFDIRAKEQLPQEDDTSFLKKTVLIHSLDIHVNVHDTSNSNANTESDSNTLPCKVRVYTRSGSYQTHETSPDSNWVVIVNDAIISCRGFQERTIIPEELFQGDLGDEQWPVRLEPGDVRAFYIVMLPLDIDDADTGAVKTTQDSDITVPMVRYSPGTEVGRVFVEDKNLQILEGAGLGELFREVYQPRVWNGVAHYSIEETVNYRGNGDNNGPDEGSIGFYFAEEDSDAGEVQGSSLSSETPLDTGGTIQNSAGCNIGISTGFSDNLGSYGNMFDIRTGSSTIYLYGMDFYTDVLKEVTYQIYTKSGRFFTDKGLEDLNAWNLIAKGTINGGGPGKGTRVPEDIFSPIIVPTNSRQAFYVTLDTPDLRYRNCTVDKQVGDPSVYDENVVIEIGVGVGSYPLNARTQFFNPRLFLGELRYETANPCPTSSPTRPPTPEFECMINSYLATSMSGTDNSYGSMVDVRAKEIIIITALEFKVNLAPSDAIGVTVFTKGGSHSGYEHDIGAWTKICQTTLINWSFGPSGGVLIPENAFRKIRMEKYDVRSFYVMLTAPHIMYTPGSSVGRVVVYDDALMILEGSGTEDKYPFELENTFSPQIFNGAFHYRRGTACDSKEPSMAPTTLMPTPFPTRSPTSQPTIPPIRETSVLYSFFIEHAISLLPFQIFHEVDGNVQRSLQGFLQTDDTLVMFGRFYDLRLQSVLTEFGSVLDISAPCSPSNEQNICTPINTLVKLTHSSYLDAGMLRYELLEYAEEVTANLASGSFQTDYVGDKAVDTRTVMTLDGVPPKKMGEKESSYFEDVTRKFLDGIMQKNSSANILFVKVENQYIRSDLDSDSIEDSSNLRGGSLRRLQSTSSTLDIEVVVTGQYRPPPELNFDALVEDSINAEQEVLVEKLKEKKESIMPDSSEYSSYFSEIKQIKAKMPPTPSPTTAGTELTDVITKSKGLSLTTIALIVVGCLVFLFFSVLCIIYLVCTKDSRNKNKRRKRKNGDTLEFCDADDQPPNHRSLRLSVPSLVDFSRMQKKQKKENNNGSFNSSVSTYVSSGDDGNSGDDLLIVSRQEWSDRNSGGQSQRGRISSRDLIQKQIIQGVSEESFDTDDKIALRSESKKRLSRSNRTISTKSSDSGAYSGSCRRSSRDFVSRNFSRNQSESAVPTFVDDTEHRDLGRRQSHPFRTFIGQYERKDVHSPHGRDPISVLNLNLRSPNIGLPPESLDRVESRIGRRRQEENRLPPRLRSIRSKEKFDNFHEDPVPLQQKL